MERVAYVPDTEVHDDPEDPPHRRLFPKPTTVPPATGRVPTQELTMHVFHNGAYHRRIPTLQYTACEDGTDRGRLHSEFAGARDVPKPRREELRHPLCRDGCFTPFELRIADELDAFELAHLTQDPDPKEPR
jgi:hypothetical protein